MTGRARSLAASVVGWLIVALVAWWMLGAVVGAVRWLVRLGVVAVVFVGLVVLYLRLRRPGPR